jgi:hypothetical protein
VTLSTFLIFPCRPFGRGGIPAFTLWFVVTIAAFFAPLSAEASTVANFTGHYELVLPHPGHSGAAERTFTLTVNQKRNRADASFSATTPDDLTGIHGTGKGRVESGVLSFAFTDNYKNEGTCTLEIKGNEYHLSMTITKAVDPRSFHFYGTVLLDKTPDPPRT